MQNLMLFLLASTACSCVSAEQDQRHNAAASPDVAAFVERLDSLRKAANIPGLSVAVVKDEAIVLALGLGHADAEQRIPATAETPYDIASVAKPLSAVVALRLVEEGVLDLDRPMEEYANGQRSAASSADNRRYLPENSAASRRSTRSDTCSLIRPRRGPATSSPTTPCCIPGRRGPSWRPLTRPSLPSSKGTYLRLPA